MTLIKGSLGDISFNVILNVYDEPFGGYFPFWCPPHGLQNLPNLLRIYEVWSQ